MLNKVRIKNFKCFSDVTFELGNLNLLAGSNGCGKSSMIQALLLLKQSQEQFGLLNRLSTYGKYVNLGLSNDIFYDYSESTNDTITFAVQKNGQWKEYEYQYVSEKSILNSSTR